MFDRITHNCPTWLVRDWERILPVRDMTRRSPRTVCDGGVWFMLRCSQLTSCLLTAGLSLELSSSPDRISPVWPGPGGQSASHHTDQINPLTTITTITTITYFTTIITVTTITTITTINTVTLLTDWVSPAGSQIYSKIEFWL